MAASDVGFRTSEPPRLHLLGQTRAILARREVLGNLTSKELKVKYKSTVLGVIWSMLNPLLYLLVFFLVFTFFLRSGIPDFAVYLLSGLLGYTMFSTGLMGATGSIVDNAALVSKIAFPREILPLSTIGAALVNFFYQFLVLIAFLLAIGYSFIGPAFALVPGALAVLLLFTTALGLGTAALNVRYRDTRHLIELSLIAWFWVTPIVYPASLVLDRLGEASIAARVYLANPLTAITLAFQRAIYGGESESLPELPVAGITWYWYRLGLVAAASIVLLVLTWRTFFRMSGDFAEEL
jgi:ABC-2 type transport system permease protein